MMKKVYICSPLGGDVAGNLQRAKQYAKYALLCGTAPVVPHFYALCLNDDNPKEREIGLAAGLSLLWFCDELWVFGDRVSHGMEKEINFAKNLNIRTCYIKESQVKQLSRNKEEPTMRNKKIMRILLCAVLMMVIVSTFSVTAFAAGDVAGAIEQTWNTAKTQVQTVVNNVVFPVVDMILAILFFVKLGTAYFDYRKHGQFEFTAPAILFACLIFTLTAPLYIWTIL